MIQIQPVPIWVNGGNQDANVFNLSIVNDNLSSWATLYYQLGKAADVTDLQNTSVTWLQAGNLSISGQEYIDWNNQPNVNAWIYTWAIAQLNLTVV